MQRTATLGERMVKTRADRNLSRQSLAVILEVSYVTVRGWECGFTEPSKESLAKIEAWLARGNGRKGK